MVKLEAKSGPRRIVFMGTPHFAIPSLQAIIDGDYQVCAVITQPDRPSGRGHKLRAAPIKTHANDASIPVFDPPRIRQQEHQPLLESLGPDFLVVVAYGQILPRWVLALPRIAPVNLHASLLPRHRGAAPVASAILAGDAVTGVTTMLMEEALDAGPILLQKEVPMHDHLTMGELEEVLSRLGADLLVPTLDGLVRNTINPQVQDEALTTYAPKITKDMARIAWDEHARQVERKIRAMRPRPTAHTVCMGQRLQVLRGRVVEFPSAGKTVAGEVLGLTSNGLIVGCGGETALELLEVRVAGKKSMSARAMANGLRISAGMPAFRS